MLIFFCDSDKDDLYTLCLLSNLHKKSKIKLEGIVIDDGFLDIEEGLKLVSFWCKLLNLEVTLFKGSKRDNSRKFPESFITSYLKEMKEEFNYLSNEKVEGKELKELDVEDKIAFVTGPLTTVAALDFNKFKRIHVMGGNYMVQGNIESGEYNVWLNSQSYDKVLKEYKGLFTICPLDCTNYTPLNKKIVDKIKDKESLLYRLLKTTLKTINTDLYMWDLTALVTLLRPNICKYKLIKVNVADGGYFYYNKKGKKVYLFDYINLKKMLKYVNYVNSIL